MATLGVAPSAWATTAGVASSTLTVTGTASADQIIVKLPGGDGITPNPATGVPDPPPDQATAHYEVSTSDAAGITPQAGCTGVGTALAGGGFAQVNCPRGGVAFGAFAVRVNGGDGNDWLQTIMPTQALGDLALVNGGGGNDAIFGSENEEVMMGAAGDDLIDAGAGGDFVSGGIINEISPGIVAPTFEGGVPQPSTYSPGGPGAGKDRLYGGGFDDQMTDGDIDSGTASTTSTAPFNNDLVDGGVCAGEPLPTGVPIPAGLGTTCPLLAANVDNPEDHDAIMLAHRTKALVIDVNLLTPTQGGPGENEQIRRIEAVWGGAGNDRFFGRDGDFGDDSLRGNGGNDHLDARGGDDELLGGDGSDTLIGGAGADVINPGSKLISQTPTATVTTSDGPDHIDGGPNSTIIGGHSQSDLVTYEGRSEPMTLDMRTGFVGSPGENDRIIGIEDIMGGHRDDVIVGDAVQNLISGDPQPPVINVPPDPPLPPGPPGGHFGNDHITTKDGHADTVDCTEGAGDVHVADGLDASINCETVQRPACANTIDDDGDGKADHPSDPGCTDRNDDDEFNPVPACSDGKDNDGDGKIDLNDIGCTGPNDPDETNRAGDPLPACADKKDNDGDGAIDYPADKGCSAAGDPDETQQEYRPPGDPKIGGPNNAGRVRVDRNGSFRLARNLITCPDQGNSCAVRTTVTAKLTSKSARRVTASAKKRTVTIGTRNYTVKSKARAAKGESNRGTVRGKLKRGALRLLKQFKAMRATVNVRVAWEGKTKTRKISVTLQAPKKSKRSKRR